jgi:hypothetical protein
VKKGRLDRLQPMRFEDNRLHLPSIKLVPSAILKLLCLQDFTETMADDNYVYIEHIPK